MDRFISNLAHLYSTLWPILSYTLEMFKLNLRELWMIMSLNMFKIFSHAYRKVTDCMALEFFPEIILVLKMDCVEGILNWIKIDRMANDHLSSCNL